MSTIDWEKIERDVSERPTEFGAEWRPTHHLRRVRPAGTWLMTDTLEQLWISSEGKSRWQSVPLVIQQRQPVLQN